MSYFQGGVEVQPFMSLHQGSISNKRVIVGINTEFEPTIQADNFKSVSLLLVFIDGNKGSLMATNLLC